MRLFLGFQVVCCVGALIYSLCTIFLNAVYNAEDLTGCRRPEEEDCCRRILKFGMLLQCWQAACAERMDGKLCSYVCVSLAQILIRVALEYFL